MPLFSPPQPVPYREYLLNGSNNYLESIVLPSLIADCAALTTQVMTLVAVPCYQGAVVTNISFKSHTTAAGTPTNWWFALYDPNFNLIAQSADQGAAAWGTFTAKTLALTAPYTIPAAGVYYAAIMVKATTPPSLDGISSSTSQTAAAAYTAGQKLIAGTFGAALTTTAPGSAATPAATGSIPYCVLS